MTTKAATKYEWLTREEAMILLECSKTAFFRLVGLELIRTRDFGHRRYWREDVERLAVPSTPLSA